MATGGRAGGEAARAAPGEGERLEKPGCPTEGLRLASNGGRSLVERSGRRPRGGWEAARGGAATAGG
eukprot:9985595-Alexandrium_andersonii.AAC.1